MGMSLCTGICKAEGQKVYIQLGVLEHKSRSTCKSDHAVPVLSCLAILQHTDQDLINHLSSKGWELETGLGFLMNHQTVVLVTARSD